MLDRDSTSAKSLSNQSEYVEGNGIDELCGTAAFNGTPVRVTAAR
jgi:hypothetical protein